ncbi:MAG: HIT domain-containing protein [Kiritimatiellaeota bacterium]|nr:HIT domain-containing protein [Kiritimatiellota bacterium]
MKKKPTPSASRAASLDTRPSTLSSRALWAPWRIRYVQNTHKPAGCFLCAMLKAPRTMDREHLLLLRGKTCLVCLNRYPYSGGHLMIAPRRHVADLAELRPAEQAELMQLATKLVTVLRKVMNPQGFNLGFNLGHAAGAGLRDHLHLHLVPRWVGDVNFMPVFADIKVIPQALEELYDQLAAELRKP